MSQPCHFLRAITSLWFNSLGTNNSPRVYLSLISLAKRTASCFWEEALALPTYLGLTPWLSLGCKPHHMHVRMILKIFQWVSGVAEAGKQKLSFPFGGRQPWQHELSCFIKSAALQSSLCTLISLPWTRAFAPVLLSHSLANKPPAMLLTQFFSLLHSVA